MRGPATTGRWRRSNRPAPSQQIGLQAEAAMRAVRVFVAGLACVVLGAYRPVVEHPSLASIGVQLAAVLAVTVILNLVSRWIGRRQPWTAVLQAGDVAAACALAVILGRPLGQQSWMLLIIPLVYAAVRWGAAAVAMSWLAGTVIYVVAVSSDLGGTAADVNVVARVPGTLLAVALAVAILARWMREGWEVQNELTETIAQREARLAVIEATIPALGGLEGEEALEVTAGQALALGFDAVTVDLDRDAARAPLAVGDVGFVADRAGAPMPSEREPAVTVWTDRDLVRAHSVAVLESQTNSVITAWSKTPVDRDRAGALATLVSHTTASIEMASRLRRLRESAALDPLTGLLNRRALDGLLREHTSEAGCLSVAFIDLDDFKAVNDRYGHDVGDKVLVALGQRLMSVAAEYGVVARYGGDEFVVVLPNVGFDDAGLFAVAALESLDGPIAFGPHQVTLGMSIGIAAAATPTNEVALMRAADEAAYRAKASGKNAFAGVDLDSGRQVAPQVAESVSGRQ